jgi:hypothetical protein
MTATVRPTESFGTALTSVVRRWHAGADETDDDERLWVA